MSHAPPSPCDQRCQGCCDDGPTHPLCSCYAPDRFRCDGTGPAHKVTPAVPATGRSESVIDLLINITCNLTALNCTDATLVVDPVTHSLLASQAGSVPAPHGMQILTLNGPGLPLKILPTPKVTAAALAEALREMLALASDYAPETAAQMTLERSRALLAAWRCDGSAAPTTGRCKCGGRIVRGIPGSNGNDLVCEKCFPDMVRKRPSVGNQ